MPRTSEPIRAWSLGGEKGTNALSTWLFLRKIWASAEGRFDQPGRWSLMPGSPRSAAKQPATPRSTPKKKGSAKAQTQASKLRQAFAAFDKDQDGALSHAELVAVLSMPGPAAFSSPEEASRAADKIMADFDADEDGKLQFEEVREVTAQAYACPLLPTDST